MTTTIRGTDNSAAAPALTGNDSDTGVYFPAANKLGLVTGGTERVIVDDSGRVGVGTSTPAVPLDIDIGTDNNAIYCRSSDQYCNIALTDDVGSVKLGSDNGSLFFETGGTTSFTSIIERVRVTSDGYLRMSANSGGIQFGGDTAAANALDDYEEGTWTATLTGSTAAPTTPVTVTGKYVKIGKLVYVSCTFSVVNTTGSSGDLLVTGLPFTVVNDTQGRSEGVAMLAGYTFSAGYTYVVTRANSNTTQVSFFQIGSNAAATALGANAGVNKYVGFSQCYEVN